MESSGSHPHSNSFDDLIDTIRSRLLPALVAKWGVEVGSDVCSDVEAYAWEHRARLARMDNPLGYLYRVAQSKSRSHLRWMKRTTFPGRFPEGVHEDAALHETLLLLAALTDRQRVCILLVHAFGWSYADVAALLGVTRAVVNHDVSRGLARLREATPRTPLPSPSPARPRWEHR